MRSQPLKYFLFIILACCGLGSTQAQSKNQKISFKDSLDGKLDLSDFIIDANGAFGAFS